MSARALMCCTWALLAMLAGSGCVDVYELGADDEPWPYFFGPEATCALDVNGDFQCVGTYADGRLAIGPMDFTDMCGARECASVFEDSMLNAPADAALGPDFGCFAAPDGVQCSGRNTFGQLGRAPLTTVGDPVVRYVGANFHPVQIEVGVAHGCAISEEAGVFCWGLGNQGQLGRAASELDACGTPDAADAVRVGLAPAEDARCSTMPLPLPGFSDVVDLAVTDFTTCVLRASGEVRCFGLDTFGAAGLGGDEARVATPRALDVPPLVELVAGAGHVLGLTAGGDVWAWGSDAHGELGGLGAPSCAGQRCVVRPTRLRVDASGGVALGAGTTFVLDDLHVLRSMGRNDRGQLGRTGSMDDCAGTPCSARLERVALPRHAIHVGAGSTHACAELSDHRTFCWGAGDAGQTGDPLHEDSALPRELPGPQPHP
ncbi:MAG: hypothetical protein KC668_29425 [Myxococcales bacterium]|nr:hypothetical protein [Myxococcales bacterium]